MQERNRMSNEITEMKDHMDIKDRKINVLQRKVNMGQMKDNLFLCLSQTTEMSNWDIWLGMW